MPRSRLAVALPLLLLACSEGAQGPVAPADALEARGGDVSAPAFEESFTAWDPSRWTATEHPLGKGWFRTANVFVQEGALHLRNPAGGWDGGELRSNARTRYRVYEAKLQASAAPGSVTAFFLYEGTRRTVDEIDVELVPSRGQVWFTVWTRGVQVHHRELDLAFDATADFHEYRIDFSKSRVRFYVDRLLVTEFQNRLPTSDMFVMANAWWPTWLSGYPSPNDHRAIIDWIRY